MKFYLVYENPEATEPKALAKSYCEILITEEQFLSMSEERLLKQYFMPAIFWIQQEIKDHKSSSE